MQRLHAAQGVVGRQVQDGNAGGSRRERGVEGAAKRAKVAAAAVGRDFVANQTGRRGGINGRAGDGVGREGGTGRGGEGRARVTACRAGEMEIVVPAVRAADDAVRARRAHKLRVDDEAAVVLLRGVLPVSQLGLVAVPLADDGATGDVDEVVVALHVTAGITVHVRVPDERDSVGTGGPDDVVAVGKGDGIADVDAAAAVAGVVFDKAALGLPVVGATDDVEVACAAAVQVAEVVDHFAIVAIPPLDLDAVAKVGINNVAAGASVALEIDARAAVAKHTIIRDLVFRPTPKVNAFGAVAIA